MRSLNSWPGVALTLFALTLPVESKAQVNQLPESNRRPLYESVITVSGDSAERILISQLKGATPASRYLLRSSSSLMLEGSRRDGFSIVLPEVTSVTNSELPFGQNDGALWAGKGYSFRAMAGVTAHYGPVHVIAVPEFVSTTSYRMSLNVIDLRFSRPLPASHNSFSSPFNVVPYSIDMPYSLGDSSWQKLYPGQSSAFVDAGPIQVGAGTENEWWGPATRNPVVLSDNAAGFPHLFIRTGRPLVSRAGQFEGRWILGGLHESDFFDDDPSNDVRSLSAFAVTWKRRPSSNVSIGFARSVYSPADGYSNVFSHAFDFLKSTGHPNALPVTDSTMTPGPDQIYSFFAQWIVPRYGLDTYLEWGRTEFPKSLRDFLLQPMHTRGYTAGMEWAHPLGGGESTVRLQGEMTNVEQDGSYRFRPTGSFYTSRAVVQGYTNEGQVLGAGSGPGSSSEWLALDYLPSRFLLGANFGRTRYNNDAFFLKSNPHRCFHDVAVYPGLRTGMKTRFMSLRAEYSRIKRYNSFWQRTRGCGTNESAIGDRSSHHFSVTVSALGW
jgi:hypothetical protein